MLERRRRRQCQVASADVPAPLELVAPDASTCTSCRLCEGRTKVVFGMGDPTPRSCSSVRAPAPEEDRQGLPFVGRSGKLLTG